MKAESENITVHLHVHLPVCLYYWFAGVYTDTFVFIYAETMKDSNNGVSLS